MKKENLAIMLDSLEEIAVYVIEQDTHRILYYNKRIQDVNGKVGLGKKCHEVFGENCSECPLLTIGDRRSSHVIHYRTSFGEVADVMANRTLWDGEIPAYVITVIPHKLEFEESQGLEQIERMYTKSLVTVFNECIIANLTQDYYVNCQKDRMWTQIPVRGRFAKENENYARRVLHPDDWEAFSRFFSRDGMLRIFGEGKTQISKRLRRRMGDGTYHMVEFTATRIEQFGEDTWCVLVFRDINEEYIQEQQKNEEINHLATAARIAYQMLIAVNLTKNSYHMIEHDRFHTKRAPESGNFDELIALGVSTVAPEFQEEFIRKFSRKSLLEKFAGGEKQVSMEMRQIGNDGEYHWNATQVVRIESPYTDDVLEITMTKDIDEERFRQEENFRKERAAKDLLEAALQKAESANLAKSDFMSRMSHDIRTPMNAILGIAALAQAHLYDPERMREYLKKIEVSGTHLLGLINEVLDVSKIESGKFELEEAPFELNSLIQDTVSIVQPEIREKNQNLVVELDEKLHSSVLGDEQRLRQVLVNVLQNASKYTGCGGRIRFSASEKADGGDQSGVYQFVIEDNGIGMKQEYLGHIFEPFSRAADSRISKISGTGLGLTIVWTLIQQMGGRIQVESEYGKGSRFVITVSLLKDVSSPWKDEKAEEMPAVDFSGMKVLLVEDNELNQQIAVEMLEFLGVDVDVVANGREAVDRIKERPPFFYELVFMDIQMPVMDGLEATRQIRRNGMEGIAELPIIAMTANAFSEDIKKSRIAGMSGHLSKPISIDNLRDALIRSRRWEETNHRQKKFDFRQ